MRPGIRNGGLMRYSMMITSMLVIAYTVPAFAQQTSVADFADAATSRSGFEAIHGRSKQWRHSGAWGRVCAECIRYQSLWYS